MMRRGQGHQPLLPVAGSGGYGNRGSRRGTKGGIGKMVMWLFLAALFIVGYVSVAGSLGKTMEKGQTDAKVVKGKNGGVQRSATQKAKGKAVPSNVGGVGAFKKGGVRVPPPPPQRRSQRPASTDRDDEVAAKTKPSKQSPPEEHVKSNPSKEEAVGGDDGGGVVDHGVSVLGKHGEVYDLNSPLDKVPDEEVNGVDAGMSIIGENGMVYDTDMPLDKVPDADPGAEGEFTPEDEETMENLQEELDTPEGQGDVGEGTFVTRKLGDEEEKDTQNNVPGSFKVDDETAEIPEDSMMMANLKFKDSGFEGESLQRDPDGEEKQKEEYLRMLHSQLEKQPFEKLEVEGHDGTLRMQGQQGNKLQRDETQPAASNEMMLTDDAFNDATRTDMGNGLEEQMFPQEDMTASVEPEAYADAATSQMQNQINAANAAAGLDFAAEQENPETAEQAAYQESMEMPNMALDAFPVSEEDESTSAEADADAEASFGEAEEATDAPQQGDDGDGVGPDGGGEDGGGEDVGDVAYDDGAIADDGGYQVDEPDTGDDNASFSDEDADIATVG